MCVYYVHIDLLSFPLCQILVPTSGPAGSSDRDSGVRGKVTSS